MSVPPGWTAIDAGLKKRVENTLAVSTGLPGVDVKLTNSSRDVYLFQSGEVFYLWDTANEEAAQITEPTTYDAIVKQMTTDIAKVVVKALNAAQ